ncbi:hypothetical protein SK128_018549 [Halocaridina rubra]|uniref:Uncharacterized protein n=1 Tax=Halocaridina rubra TaxID=373956 RepID=A0AAN8X7W9_HALRR
MSETYVRKQKEFFSSCQKHMHVSKRNSLPLKSKQKDELTATTDRPQQSTAADRLTSPSEDNRFSMHNSVLSLATWLHGVPSSGQAIGANKAS